jgi:sugar/nucleoside kinase (ribokinase family)
VAGVLAVLGHTARDVVDGSPPRAGGVPLYAARALAELRVRALIVTRCAPEDRPLLGSLYAVGLPVVWHPEERTPIFQLRNLGDRREIEIEALGAPWTAADVDEWLGAALAGADWVHAGALWRGDFPPDTLAALARGRRVSFDGQGVCRPGRLGPVTRDGSFEPSLLAHVDVLHLSLSEAEALGLSLDAVSLATLGVPEVVVTMGSRGSVVYARGVAEHVAAQPLDVDDATGAGDAYTIAYVASRRAGHSPRSSARRATSLVHGLLSRALAP